MSENDEPVTDPINTDPATDPEKVDQNDPDKGAKSALIAERAARKADKEKAAKELADLREKLEAQNKSAEELAIDQARRDAAAEVTAKANKKILAAELKGAAHGILADPTDALAFINLSDFETDANGDFDSDAINEAIADLLVRKPHLAAAKQNPFQGGADGGAKPPAKPDPSIGERASAALAAGDVRGSIALKTSQLKPLPV